MKISIRDVRPVVDALVVFARATNAPDGVNLIRWFEEQHEKLAQETADSLVESFKEAVAKIVDQ